MKRQVIFYFQLHIFLLQKLKYYLAFNIESYTCKLLCPILRLRVLSKFILCSGWKRHPTGLMSRCKNPTEWMLSIDSRICLPSRRVVLIVNVPRDWLRRRSARFRPYGNQINTFKYGTKIML